ncbi:MAG: ABC-2 family transporter protein [Polyangiaceae bacterium]
MSAKTRAIADELSTLHALFLRAVRASFAYKPALLMSMLSAGFACAIPMLVWRHVYASASHPLALPKSALFPYLLIAGCLNFGFAMNVEGRIGQRIRTGAIATDLLRPVDFQLAQLAQALSDGVFNLALMLPIFGASLLFWRTDALPASASALAAFALSLLVSFVILFAVSFIFVLATFVTYSGYGVFVARTALQQTFSGLSAPLVLFPAGLRTVSEWLPFRHTIHTPVSIYLGWLHGSALWRALGAQVLWAAALLFLGRFLLSRALRQFDIQGG